MIVPGEYWARAIVGYGSKSAFVFLSYPRSDDGGARRQQRKKSPRQSMGARSWPDTA